MGLVGGFSTRDKFTYEQQNSLIYLITSISMFFFFFSTVLSADHILLFREMMLNKY